MCVIVAQAHICLMTRLEIGLLYKLWDYFVLLIKVTPNHRVTLINLSCKFTSKGYFYPKNKFREVTEKKYINDLHTEMQGYYSKFKY